MHDEIKTKVILKNDVENALEDLCKYLKNLQESDGLFLHYKEETITGTSWLPDAIRLYSYGSSVRNIVGRLVLDSVGKAEQMTGGSGELFVYYLYQALVNSLLHLGDDKESMHSLLQSSSKDIYNILQWCGRAFKKEDVEVLIEQTIDSEQDSIKEAIERAGLSKQILVTKHEDSTFDTSVINRNGNTFTFPIDTMNFKLMNQSNWKAKDAKVFMFDAFIESVSEIHSILTYGANTKEPFLIIARSCSEEVMATLGENVAQGRLNCVFLISPFSEEYGNVLRDVSIVTGANVCSTFTGDLVSTKTWDYGTTVKEITVDFSQKESSNITCRILSTPEIKKQQKSAIKNEIDSLNEKLQMALEANHTNSERIFLSRIRSLSTGIIEIKVNNKLSLRTKILQNKIDVILRQILTSKSLGVISLKEIKENDNCPLILKNTIKSYLKHKRTDDEIVPIKTIIIIQQIIENLTKMLHNIGAIVLFDKEQSK